MNLMKKAETGLTINCYRKKTVRVYKNYTVLL